MQKKIFITIALLAFFYTILKAQKVSIIAGLGYNYDNLYTNHTEVVHPNQANTPMIWRTKKNVQGNNLMVQFNYNVNKKSSIVLKAVSGKSFEKLNDSINVVTGGYGIFSKPIQRSFSLVTLGIAYSFFILDNFQVQYQLGAGLLTRYDQEIYFDNFFLSRSALDYSDLRQNTQINNYLIAENILSFYYVQTKKISWGLRISGIFSKRYFEKLIISPIIKISI